MRRFPLLAATLLIAALSFGPAAAQQDQAAQPAAQYATGFVFNDANLNGLRDQDEKGLSGVRVCNGRTSVRTDRSGSYKIQIDDDTIVWVVKPRNWRTGVDANNVPRFYYINKPKGSPKLKYSGVDPTGPLPASVDFPLYAHREPNRFRAVFIGDTQVNSLEDIAYLGHDIIEELVGTDAAFGVSLGDIVNNDLSLFEPLLPVMGQMGIPCYYVKGNHDTNYDAAPNQKLIDETFERVFGPSHYSFDYGPVHFVAINDPYFGQAKGYIAQLDAEQLEFLRDDLASIPKDQLVVLMMHIPIFENTNRAEAYTLLESHPNVFAIAGHWHTQKNCFLSTSDGWNGAKPLHLLVNVTSCGSWWAGSPDEVGIPHTTMRDGAPNGYSVVTFDGAKYSVRFKAARRPEDYQMNIYAPDRVEAVNVAETEVLVNVFAGSERSKVEMRLGDRGAWVAMERAEIEDPVYASIKKLEDGLKPRPGASLPGAEKSPHMWKAKMPKDATAGTYLIQVRATDMFGQTCTGCRAVTIR